MSETDPTLSRPDRVAKSLKNQNQHKVRYVRNASGSLSAGRLDKVPTPPRPERATRHAISAPEFMVHLTHFLRREYKILQKVQGMRMRTARWALGRSGVKKEDPPPPAKVSLRRWLNRPRQE
jgi:hypothetical protein